jgi:uncharacterized damage-inducible protein DinB
MRVLDDLLRYNHWANCHLFALAARASAEQMSGEQPGVYGPLGETLRHMVAVENNFLRVIRGEATERIETSDVGELWERILGLASEYREALADEPALDRVVFVPWLRGGAGFEMPISDAVIQAVTHSIQHRADVIGALSRIGIEPPGLDYVRWLMAGRPEAP